jgi:hypothetical protein
MRGVTGTSVFSAMTQSSVHIKDLPRHLVNTSKALQSCIKRLDNQHVIMPEERLYYGSLVKAAQGLSSLLLIDEQTADQEERLMLDLPALEEQGRVLLATMQVSFEFLTRVGASLASSPVV